MRQFHFYIDDKRSGVPREAVIEAEGEVEARELADQVLRECEHHAGVEVCERGVRVFGLGSFATRTWCGVKQGAAG
jgi:hypothetical protein